MVDITIYGAGIFGLSIAWSCIKLGAKVQVIDPYGVGAGSSGGIVGALAPHTPENWNSKKAFQFESLMMAEEFWTEVKTVGGGESGYARTGRLQPIVDERGLELARQREQNAASLWEKKADWRIVSEKDVTAWCPYSPTGLFVLDTLTARIHPRHACEALSKAILSCGGTITEQGAPEGIIIDATGWRGLLKLSEEVNRPVGNGVKGQALLLKLDRRSLPQLFADTVHFVPHYDGTVAIGSTSEREFASPTSTDDQLEALWQRACRAVPEISNAAIIHRWAGVRPRAKSRAPMLGAHPSKPGAFIANGGFKIGFGMAPKIGEIMANLVLNQINDIPAAFKAEASL